MVSTNNNKNDNNIKYKVWIGAWMVVKVVTLTFFLLEVKLHNDII